MPKSDRKIMIIEDDLLIAQDITMILARQGFTQFMRCRNLIEAKAKLPQFMPELLLLDLNLPDNLYEFDVCNSSDRFGKSVKANFIHPSHKLKQNLNAQKPPISLSGIEFAQFIQDQAKIPFIIISGYLHDKQAKNLLQMPFCRGMIVKPFHPSNLIDIVGQAICTMNEKIR